MTNRKPALRRWPRSCATGIALEASQRPVSSFRVFILGDPWHTVCSDGLHNTFSERRRHARRCETFSLLLSQATQTASPWLRQMRRRRG